LDTDCFLAYCPSCSIWVTICHEIIQSATRIRNNIYVAGHLVAEENDICIEDIERWSKAEDKAREFEHIKNRLLRRKA